MGSLAVKLAFACCCITLSWTRRRRCGHVVLRCSLRSRPSVILWQSPTGAVAPDFVAHCYAVLSHETATLDVDLCQLALVLDPCYKQIAASEQSAVALADKVILSLQKC